MMTRDIATRKEENGIKSRGQCECGGDLVCPWEWEYGAERHAQWLEEKKRVEALKEIVRLGESR